jgi:hypothetical protein
MSLLQLINELNQECNFTESINESTFIESIKKQESKNLQYKSLVECIFSNYDPLYQTIPNHEKNLYVKKLIMKICSDIDENSEKYYDTFNFNPKIMKKNIIQISLQLSEQKKNSLSSIFYLNDYYKTHFVIVCNQNNFETCVKNYKKDYILYQNHKYSFVSTDNSYPFDDLSKIPLLNDLKKGSIYLNFLGPVSKYKINELKEIASGLNLSLVENGKSKIKQILYDEINYHQLNLIQ